MDSEKPFISVIIPNFNRGDLLKETLESLVMQEFRNWEAIVVDDGSDDGSEEIVKRFMKQDRRFSFFKRDRLPSGAPVCRNIGISRSGGNFLLFLDSDDLLKPFALAQRAEATIKEPGYDFWVFPMLMFREDPSKANVLWNIDNGKPDLLRFLVLDGPWQTSGPLWRREAVIKINGFTEGLACWQDVDFHLKALIAGLKGIKLYNSPPDVLYRQHETQSVSQGEISSPAKLKSRREIFMRHANSLVPYSVAGNQRHEPGSKPQPLVPEEIKASLSLLGGNIAIGAAKTLNYSICLSVILFGIRKGIFSAGVALTLLLILVFYFLRFNRIPFFDRKTGLIIQKYRQDSGIGKHPYIQSKNNGTEPGR